MKSLWRWLGAFALSVGLTTLSYGAGNTDLQDLCTGANQSNCPYKVDASGNVTAAGRVTSAGVTSTGTNTFSGTTNLTGPITPTGIFAPVRSTESGVTASSTIINTAMFVVVTTTSPAAAVVTSATPTISTTTATDGQFIVIKGTSSTATFAFQDNGTLAGSLLELGAASRVVSDLKVLGLMYDGTIGKWLEVFYGNN